MSSNNTRGSFFYTLLGYLAMLLGLLVIALIIGVGVYRFVVVPKRFVSDDTFMKWVGLPVFTFSIFWWVIKESRPRWHNKVFWWTIVAVLFFHIAGFLVAFRYVEHWRAFEFFVICTLEVPVIMAVVNWTFEKFGKKRHLNGGAAQL